MSVAVTGGVGVSARHHLAGRSFRRVAAPGSAIGVLAPVGAAFASPAREPAVKRSAGLPVAGKWFSLPTDSGLPGRRTGDLPSLSVEGVHPLPGQCPHTLFNRPGAFQSYIAASPSIRWNDRAALDGEPGFAAQVRSGLVAPRILITVGGPEQSTENFPRPLESINRDSSPGTGGRNEVLRPDVDNARELTERFSETGVEGDLVPHAASLRAGGDPKCA